MSHTRIVSLLSLVLLLNGCALLSKGDVPMRRYFSPDLPPAADATRGQAGTELRLGRITAGASIAERIMFRESDHEVGFYDDRIWTEKPESYLRRALTRVLFEEQGLRSVMRGAGPTLDVELISFEEVMAPQHVGRVKLAFTLSDERLVSMQQTLAVDVPITDGEATTVAHAMGEALRQAVYQLSGRVIASLGSPASAPCPVAARQE